jgi:predicted nucleic acid-binding protein
MASNLIDTNVLVYALFPSSSQHKASRSLLEKAKDPNAGLSIFPQMFAEFFAVVTNPKRVSSAKTPEQALHAVEQFLTLPGLALLPLPADVATRWVQLVRSRPVKGGEVFDLQAAAGMLAHGIRTVYTFNLADFQDIPGVEAKEPPSPGNP